MDLMTYADDLRFGELHIKNDTKTGLKAIVAMHDLTLGPGIGGCRCIPYPTTQDAMRDAMRLARGMTYKAAISGLPHGGAKSVIMRPARLEHGSEQRRALFRAFGDFIESLGGRYLAAEDSGTTPDDMNTIRERTSFVLGSTHNAGTSGDPSPSTAFGVRRGIQACVKFRFGRDDMDGVKVAIQGVGAVGYHLGRELRELGARLIVTDVDAGRIKRAVRDLGAEAVAPDAIYDVDADIFAPCALGAVINDATIPRLKVAIVAGASNNQLSEDRHGLALKERGIVYAPDYALNAGGLINVASEYEGFDAEKSRERQAGIYDTIASILERSERENTTPHQIADAIVHEILAEASERV